MPIYRNKDGEPEPEHSDCMRDLIVIAFVAFFGVPTLIAAIIGIFI
jgi:hypothetical protein